MDNKYINSEYINKQSKEISYKIAVASSDGIVVNQHFGRADTFYIYEMTEKGQYKLLEKRSVLPVCHSGNHDENELYNTICKVKDCKYILVSKIGIRAASIMGQSGIIPMELPGMIEESINRLITYEQLQNLLKL